MLCSKLVLRCTFLSSQHSVPLISMFLTNDADRSARFCRTNYDVLHDTERNQGFYHPTRVTPFSAFLVNFRSDCLILLDGTSYETLIIVNNTQLLSLFSIWAFKSTEGYHHRHHQTANYELRINTDNFI